MGKEQKSSTPPDREIELEQNLLGQRNRISREREEQESVEGVFVSISLSFCNVNDLQLELFEGFRPSFPILAKRA